MPVNQAAWIAASTARPLQVSDAAYNTPGEHDIVIKSAAVAINPVDWKMQEHDIFINEYPSISCCDVAGVVDEVGSSVFGFQKGDRVIGQAPCLVHGKAYGAFQHYVLCPANVACKIPDWMSFEQASVLPLAVNTAGIGFFSKDILGLPLPSAKPAATDLALFIYGGSTSVGSVAIQLAKAAGVFVVTTASKRNHDHCKTLGADSVLDYSDPDWTSQAAEAMKARQIAGVYDCISTEDTTKACQSVLEKAGAKDRKVVIVGPIPEGIDCIQVFGANVTNNDALAKAIWADYLPHALSQRTLIPKPDAEVIGSGLGSIQKAMDMNKAGVSAKKVVVSLP